MTIGWEFLPNVILLCDIFSLLLPRSYGSVPMLFRRRYSFRIFWVPFLWSHAHNIPMAWSRHFLLRSLPRMFFLRTVLRHKVRFPWLPLTVPHHWQPCGNFHWCSVADLLIALPCHLLRYWYAPWRFLIHGYFPARNSGSGHPWLRHSASLAHSLILLRFYSKNIPTVPVCPPGVPEAAAARLEWRSDDTRDPLWILRFRLILLSSGSLPL